MSAEAQTISKGQLWAGRIIGGLPALFLLVDAIMKFVKPAPVVETTVKLGYPENVIIGLGAVLLISTILYLIPKTSVLGAILLTGYLGGAVATHVRVQEGWFPIVFPVVFGALLWLSLYLRDERLRALLPVKS
jgi:DoxX-like family